MIINFLGDSITEGAGTASPKEMFANIVGERLSAEVHNYGLGGTRIARQSKPSLQPQYDCDFLARAKEMGDADYVFVFGGTNDYGHGDAEIGDSSDETPYTFYGAVNLLARSLAKRYGADRLCFILPLPRVGEDNVLGEGNKEKPSLPLKGYIAIIREVLNALGISYIDLRAQFPAERLAFLTVDGLHPNAAGNLIIADEICNYLSTKKGEWK